MNKPRDLFSTLAIIGGLLLVLYPTISNFFIMRNASRVVEGYDEAVEALSDEEAARLMGEARAYNAKLAGLSGIPAAAGGWDVSDPQLAAQLEAEYASLLNLNGDGVMGYVTIPRLDETMPMYHTTEEKVLLETTSLPVGGASTHAAISGHRGLPSAKLFTELDEMREGDVFYVRVLKETFAYQVDRILTVLPHETEPLAIEAGADQMTLVTCTPYGINSHRLLVRAHAIPYVPSMDDEVGAMGSPINLSWPHIVFVLGLVALAAFFASLRSRELREREARLEVEAGRAYGPRPSATPGLHAPSWWRCARFLLHRASRPLPPWDPSRWSACTSATGCPPLWRATGTPSWRLPRHRLKTAVSGMRRSLLSRRCPAIGPPWMPRGCASARRRRTRYFCATASSPSRPS